MIFKSVRVKGNDCVSYQHRGQAALRLDCGLLVVIGNEYVSCLYRGQAATRLVCCMDSNIFALTLIDVKMRCGAAYRHMSDNKEAPQCMGETVRNPLV